MHGCCLGDLDDAGALGGTIPWGYLGQDGTDSSFVGPQEPPGTVSIDASGNFLDANGNVLNPDGTVNAGATQATMSQITAGQVATVANGGSTGNPSTDANIANILAAAGGAAQTVLRQIQLGQIASNVPIGNTALQAAIVGGSSVGIGAGVSSVLSSVASNPMLLLGLGVLAFVILRKK